jgi:hypothetical protein
MAPWAVRARAYIPKEDCGPSVPARSVEELIGLYGARMKGEIQRLRVNLGARVFVAFETQIGYVQREPERAPPSIYCQAQSAESWPALAAVLTPERVARLHAAGYADPGRAPNHSRNYPADQFDDAAIARELLTILHEVYGCNGLPRLKATTERRGAKRHGRELERGGAQGADGDGLAQSGAHAAARDQKRSGRTAESDSDGVKRGGRSDATPRGHSYR